MYLEIKKIRTQYTRNSKLGISHTYTRTKTIALFRCDGCETLFERSIGKMDRKRLDNQYFHVCSSCDQKRFAQSKGVEKRCIWDMSADTDLDVSRL